jgi:hypothetical protein
MSPTEPLDATLVMCLRARDDIRHYVAILRARNATWEPRPCPPQEPRK